MGFDESQVNRGQPGNPGQFAPKAGAVSDSQRSRLAMLAEAQVEQEEADSGEALSVEDVLPAAESSLALLDDNGDFDALRDVGLIDPQVHGRAVLALRELRDSLKAGEVEPLPEAYVPPADSASRPRFGREDAENLARLEEAFEADGGRGVGAADEIDRLRALREGHTAEGLAPGDLVGEVEKSLALLDDNGDFDTLRDRGQINQVKYVEAVYAVRGLRDHLLAAAPDAFEALPSGAQRSWLAGMAEDEEPGSSVWPDRTIDSRVYFLLEEGPLRSGVVNRQRREALGDWNAWARERWKVTGDPAYEQFRGGLAITPVLMVGRHLDPDNPEDPFGAATAWATTGQVDPDLHDRAARLIGIKRSRAEAREHWRKMLKVAPSEAAWRGAMTAAAVMSGAEDSWDLNADRDRTVVGDLIES